MANDVLGIGAYGTFSPLVYAFKGQAWPAFASGQYYCTPPYGTAPLVGMPQYRESIIGFPGVMDGVSTKRFYFQSRLISLVLAFLGANKQACNANWDTIATQLTALARYSVTMPGGQLYTNCKCRSAGRGERWPTMGPGCFALIVNVPLTQLSTGVQL